MFKKFIITGPDGRPYLERTYLLDTRWGGIYFHKILVSDPDRDLHDHPWKFLSVLLWGHGYYEHQPDGTKKYFSPFSINWRRDPAEPHRLELPKERGREQPQWTLVFIGRKVRDWGFHVPRERAAEYGPFPPVDGTTWDDPDLEPYHSRYVKDAVWIDFRSYLDVKFPDGWQKEPGYDEKPIQGGK